MKLFVDRDLGKRLPRALKAVGVEATAHIDRYPTADAESIEDREWIREAVGRGELLITRDGTIRRREVEIGAIVRAEGACVVLETGNGTPLVYLRALMIAWPEIERLVNDERPPWVFGLSRDGRMTRRYPPPS